MAFLSLIGFNLRFLTLLKRFPTTTLAGLIAFTLLLPEYGNTQSDSDRNLPLKAAYVFNFTKLVQWPLSEDNSFINLCLPADSRYLNAFRSLQKKPTRYGRIRLITFRQQGNIDNCQIAFIPNDASLLPKISAEPSQGTLIICEDETPLNEHWSIKFFIENNKLRFNINLKSATSAHLKISSKLLLLAAGVIQ